MSESEGIQLNGGELQDFTIDQLAGALALSLGAVGTLLLVIWQSRCACRCRLGCSDKCYIFDCERAPPPDPVASEPEPEAEEEPDSRPVAQYNTRSKTAPRPAEPEPETEQLM